MYKKSQQEEDKVQDIDSQSVAAKMMSKVKKSMKKKLASRNIPNSQNIVLSGKKTPSQINNAQDLL